jgi:hypothetical protein
MKGCKDCLEAGIRYKDSPIKSNNMRKAEMEGQYCANVCDSCKLKLYEEKEAIPFSDLMPMETMRGVDEVLRQGAIKYEPN